MCETNEIYCTKQFILMTLDPVHIGTGGQRLGRVDNSIVREPGTRLPKIPGTSLHGAIRQYAAYRYGKRQCAGQKGHCGRPTCPICYTFGFVGGDDKETKQAHSGVVSIGDARLLLFPVYSLAGPVWVTCPSILHEFGISEKVPDNQVRLPKELSTYSHLNLGWLMLKKDSENFTWQPDKIKGICPEITNRTVLVSDKLFSQVVNSNLEVRTSVSIDPDTGAAVEGALFTYEAIPRAAILWLEVVEDNYRKTEKKYTDNGSDSLGVTRNTPLDVVRSGLKWAENLGIGGMGTRGFGRVRLLNKEAK